MTPKDSGNSARIAKNAIALYIRMAIATIVSLYTSRIVLKELGVDGYGTYTLVAGIVTFWLFINGSMTTASIRFLSVAVESRDELQISRVFSSVFWVHISLAIILILLGETIGLYFFSKLKISPELLVEAKVVYQLSIVSVAIGILQVPFTAMCVAEEKMGIFAVLEIVNSLLKLITAMGLVFVTDEKLVIYALLLLISSAVLLGCYYVYSRKTFEGKTKIHCWDFDEIKNILGFTSWDLYGNGAVSLRMQGTAVLYNLFINTAANAALGISLQVHGVITSFANNIATAIRPQITKSYVSSNYDYMESLVISSTKLMGAMLLLIIIPLIIVAPFILHLWLGTYPEFTIGFTQLSLIAVFYWSFSTLSHSIIHATGRVKKYSFISGTVVLSEVLVMYFSLKFIHYAYIPQLLRIIVLIMLGMVMLNIIHQYIPVFNRRRYVVEIYIRGTLSLGLCGLVPYLISTLHDSNWLQLINVIVANALWTPFIVWFLFFSKTEREMCIKFTKSFLSRRKVNG